MVDAPVMGPWALLAPPASTRTSSTAPSLRAMALALPAAPGQANGTSIFGGGIYGTAATSYSTRADGLPLLNSKPGAPFSVFLDFDGWSGRAYSGSNEVWTPYDVDGNSATFGTTEETNIAEGWRRMAAYMSPFNVNVTTVQPANGNNWSWNVISNSGGGYSYGQLGSYAPSAFNPSSDLLGRFSGVLHELGHNFGLAHQSLYDATGAKTSEYRGKIDSIHGVVMGVDYDGTPPKWIAGHPSGSAISVQDDLTTIAGKIKPYDVGGSDGYRTDDDPNTIALAAVLPNSAGVQSTYGIIERLSDADAYKFTSTGGGYTISLAPDSPSPLDGKVELYDGSGNLMAVGDDVNRIDVTMTLSLPAGDYYAIVKGHSNYGDIGAYQLKVAAGTPAATPGVNGLSAPTNLVTSAGAGTQIDLSWDAVPGATSYRVERSTDGVTFTIASGTYAATTMTNDPGYGSARFVYRIRANDGSGYSTPSDPSVVINKPAAVGNFHINSISTSQLVLDWVETTGETGYRIERSTDGTTFAVVGSGAVNGVSYNDTGLAIGTPYTYRVIPLSALGDGVTSLVVTAKTRLPAVSGLAFTARTSTSLSFAWTDQTQETGYRIERSLDNTTWSTLTTTTANVTSYTNTGLTSAGEYYYRVTAMDGTTPGVSTAAIFSSTPASNPPAAPWTGTDIGNPAGFGTTGLTGGVYTVVSNGADVYGTSDQFHFTSQPLNGDGTMIARVATQEQSSSWSKVGVMIRESTAANSRHAFMMITPGNGAAFQWRSNTGGNSSNSNTTNIGGVSPAAPYWVKMVRVGNVFTGYASPNGSTWTQVGQATIAMSANALVGLAASSVNASLLNTSTIDNVSLVVPNAAPVAVNDSVTTLEDTAVIVNVLGNDTDANGDTLSVTTVTSAAHGTAVLNANNTITYTPNLNYNGPDSFSYAISDGKGGSATATVSITVTPVNDNPVATNDTATTPDGTPVVISVLANDSDVDGDTLSVTAVSTPAHGSAAINLDGTITYTSNSPYSGPDAFTYTISDGKGGSATASVAVTVTAVNHSPVAVNDSAFTAEDTAVTFAVLANDTDPDGDPLTVTAVTTPTHGSVVINPGGTLTYTPAANYFGPDSLSYTISDGNSGTASAAVAINVSSVNDNPVAVNDFASTAEDTATSFNVLTNDTDVDGDVLTLQSIGLASHGSATFNTDGTITYTPAANYNGPDSLTYSVADGQGGFATGTVAISISAVNDAPTVATPAAVDTSPVTGKTVALSALGTDIDDAASALNYTWSLISGPAAVTFSANGTNAAQNTTATFTKAGGYGFTVTIADAAGATTTSSVTVTVKQTATSVKVTPATATVSTNATLQLTAAAYDQFGATMTAQPAFTWSRTSGSGTISTTGLFTAPFAAGSAVIKATSGLLSGSSSLTIALAKPAAPTNLVATKLTGRKVKLSWRDNANNEAGFRVQTSTNGTTWTTLSTLGVAAGTGTTGTYTSAAFAVGKRYFRIMAFNTAGTNTSATVIVTL